MGSEMPTRDELVAVYEAAVTKFQDAKVALRYARDGVKSAEDAETAASSAYQTAIAAVRAAERAMFERVVSMHPQGNIDLADG